MHVDLILQICKLLSASGDLTRGINTVLIMLNEYLGIRNSILLIRDSVTCKYFIELAPELNEEEKTKWNQKASEAPSSARFKLQHEMILSPDEIEQVQLPNPLIEKLENYSIVVVPIYGKNQGLPLGVLASWIPNNQTFAEKFKILRVTVSLIALTMEAHGVHTEKLYDTPTGSIPMVLEGVVAVSHEMKRLSEMVKKVAPSRATILIRGESGTGKELIAQSLHEHSLRNHAPFVSVNCAALSNHVLESELFGHEKGAFTNAVSQRKGRFEIADGGTLFLDEIGDTSIEFQTKLLRVLQEGEFERLGSSQTRRVDVRIVCATNVDLEQSIQQGSFREDLYYRLNVVSLRVPPIRERRADVPPLVQYFLDRLNLEYQKDVKISQEDMDYLQQQNWPGNVRQIENAVHSAYLMESQGKLNIQIALQSGNHLSSSNIKPQTSGPTKSLASSTHVETEETFAIQEALKRSKGIQIRAAEELGISLRQLRYRIKKYNIPVRKIL